MYKRLSESTAFCGRYDKTFWCVFSVHSVDGGGTRISGLQLTRVKSDERVLRDLTEINLHIHVAYLGR